MNTSENASQNEWLESMLGDFLDESGQLLEQLNKNLLQLDTQVQSGPIDQDHRCDETLLNEMFRSAHSLKGLSAMLGLSDINKLTHKLENVFDAARKEGLNITGDVVELMFRSVDHLERLVETLKDPNSDPIECDAIIEDIHQLLQSNGVEHKQISRANAEKELASYLELSGADLDKSNPEELKVLSASGTTTLSESAAERDSLAGIEDEANISDKYLSIFIDETGLSIEKLSEILFSIENSCSREDITKLLHILHQIKGSAACVGLNRAAKLTHLMEDVFQKSVGSTEILSPQIADAMLKWSDIMRQYLDDLKQGHSETGSFKQMACVLLATQTKGIGGESLKSRIDKSVSASPSDSPAQSSSQSMVQAGIDEELLRRVIASIPEGVPAVIGHVRFQPGLTLAGMKGQLVYDKLSNIGDICFFDPPQKQIEDMEVLEQVTFGLVTDRAIEDVREHLKIGGVEKIDVEKILRVENEQRQDENNSSNTVFSTVEAIEPVCKDNSTASTCSARNNDESPHPDANTVRDKGAIADNAGVPTETLRVDIERLDELMNLAGQLVISKARFEQSGRRLENLDL
jgi:two-component system, chemotaxis family, sensor kinase CheA